MRLPIWEKDDFFEFTNGPRYDMDAEAISFQNGVPLVTGFRYDMPPIGWVFDLRVEDEELTGELELFDPMPPEELTEKLGFMRLGGTYKGIVYNEAKTRIEACTLMSVSFMLKSNTPGFPRSN